MAEGVIVPDVELAQHHSFQAKFPSAEAKVAIVWIVSLVYVVVTRDNPEASIP
ncbi:MAG: hypothetical protein LC723_14870 [Actinobacteria bacterium]|nr:hypothetical protein [Actinomycetota bacterium]